MNQTRIVFGLACFLFGLLWTPSAWSENPTSELLHRQGRHIHLVTDLSSTAQADSLVASFDAAVIQWCEFWGIAHHELDQWVVDACLMRDQTKFERAGLIPDSLPEFPFGYALGNKIWILAQPSEYYTRHLMLHEGVHSLAFHHFGGAGPTWFMEGTAELLATHQGEGESIVVNAIPKNRESAEYWGRFKLMDQLRDKSVVPRIETVLDYQPNLIGDVETYGWSWAAAMMFHAYPEYRNAFFEAAKGGQQTGPAFNRNFYKSLSDQWPVVAARWRIMCEDLDYGFDWRQQRVEISIKDRLWDGKPIQMKIEANRGWQSIGVRIPKGVKVKIVARGQIVVDDDPKPWISEPPGVTIEYDNGRPLGQLVACMLPNASVDQGKLPPLPVVSVGEATIIDVLHHSWLLLRVNEDVGSLSDNEGQYEVRVMNSR